MNEPVNLFRWPKKPTDRAPDRPPKWWWLEIRFDQRLSRCKVRMVRRALDWYGDLQFDRRLIICDQYPEKYPTADDSRILLESLYRVKVPFQVRCAPYGRDCPEGAACGCTSRILGSAESCRPVLTKKDWISFDPMAIPGAR